MSDLKLEDGSDGLGLSNMRILGDAIANTSCPILICDATQSDMPIVYANRAFELLTGYERKEVVGRNPRFLQAEDHNQPGLEQLRAKLATGSDVDVRLRNYTKKGNLFWVELNITPVRNEENEITHYFAIQKDVSSQVSAEERARDSDNYLSSIVATVPDAMVSINTAGVIDRFSQAAEKLFGYKSTEVIGQNVSILMNEPHKAHHDQYIRAFMDTGERKIIGTKRIVSAKRKDGTTFPMTLSVGETLRDGEKYFVGFIHDETNQERVRSRLLELQLELEQVARLSAMGETAAAIAHELNQPLTASANYLQAAKLVLGRTDEIARIDVDRLLQKADDEIHRAGQIIKRMREFLKKSTGAKQPENINALIREAVELASIGYEGWHINVCLNLDDAIPEVNADKVQIEQVLVNLIRNAYEAMKGAHVRELTITSQYEPKRFVTVSVSDTGCGLSGMAEHSLFRPFNSTKRDGMGIGLSICRTIIESHGGTIKADDDQPIGSVFTFQLPLYESSIAG